MIPALFLGPLVVEERPPVPVVPERAPTAVAPYGTAGSMETSVWAGVAASSAAVGGQAGGDFGWFFANGFELSALGGLAYVHPGGAEVIGSVLAEPSVHIAFGSSVMGFTGLGGGLTFSSSGAGFELSQRVGVNVLFGKHGSTGILTPAIALAYVTNAPAITSVGAVVGYGLAW